MEINECFITTADWIKIENCNVHMNVKRRLQRTVIGNEGDDLLDEGSGICCVYDYWQYGNADV